MRASHARMFAADCCRPTAVGWAAGRPLAVVCCRIRLTERVSPASGPGVSFSRSARAVGRRPQLRVGGRHL